jgi:hypothetical protein
MYESQRRAKFEFAGKLSKYGYKYIRDIPVLFVDGQRNFVISVYARDLDYANKIFRELDLVEPLEPNLSFALYRIAKGIVRGR